MRSLFSRALAVTAILMLHSAARAAVIFSNLGPGDSYIGNSGLTIDTAPRSVASAFTPTTAALFGGVEAAIMRNPNFYAYTGNTDIALAADLGGSPGAIIEDLGVHPTQADLGTTNSGSLVAASSSFHPLLAAGTQYWIVVAPVDFGPTYYTAAAWTFNNTGNANPVRTNFQNQGWQDTGTLAPAFRISSYVPEPASLALLALSCVAVIPARRRL